VVWLAAKAENISRKEILQYPIWDFVTAVEHALKEL
jgi:hypothetical protein